MRCPCTADTQKRKMVDCVYRDVIEISQKLSSKKEVPYYTVGVMGLLVLSQLSKSKYPPLCFVLRFSPTLHQNVDLATKDDKILATAIWETRAYMYKRYTDAKACAAHLVN